MFIEDENVLKIIMIDAKWTVSVPYYHISIYKLNLEMLCNIDSQVIIYSIIMWSLSQLKDIDIIGAM